MKKFFIILSALLLSFGAIADPITLTFKDWGDTSAKSSTNNTPKNQAGDFGTAYTTTSLLDSLENASGFVTCSATNKAYAARVGMGCKLGTANATGDFTLALVTPAAYDSIVVVAASYGQTEGSMSINGGTAIDLTAGGTKNKVLMRCKYVPTALVSELTVASTEKRIFVKNIIFYPSESGEAPQVVDVTGVTLDQTTVSVEEYKQIQLAATVAPADATNKSVSWTSDNTAVATVSNTGKVTAVAPGTANITVTTADGDFTATCAVTVTAKVAPAGTAFYESFDQILNTGGNDGLWTGSIATTTFDPATAATDNSGWTVEGSVAEANRCVKMGASKATVIGGFTTPAIGKAGNGNVTFMAESWGTDGSNFYVDIIGGGTFVEGDDIASLDNEGTTAKVLMDKGGNWTTFNLEFEGLTAASQLRFYAPAGKRAFLDEVAVYVTPVAAPAKFFLSVTGYDNDNNPVTVDMSIFAGLKFVVNLPESAHSTLGANRADVKVQLTDVEGLGITGTHTYTHTITTGVKGTQAVLATKLSNAYSFGEVDVPFTFTAGSSTKTFTYNIKKEGNVITGTPSDSADAKAAWDILMTKIDATGSNAANDAHFFFAKGSTFVLGNERLTFVDDVTAALNGSSFSDIFATNDKVVIETLQGAAANTLQFYFATGSTVAVGSRTATVTDVVNFDVQNSVDLQTGYWSSIRDDIDAAAESSKKKVAIHKFMDFANDLIYIVNSSTNLQAGVLAKGIELGDVNEDGIIDVTDITKVATSILNQDYTQPFNYWAADLELNGLYNVTDITRIANIIFGIEEE